MQLASQPQITPGEKQEVARNWLTAAGVVVATTGMIAAAPGLSPIPATLQHDMATSAVRLTAGWDPLAAWKDALDTSIANGTTLGDNFLLAPGVGLQQAIVNQIGYAKQFFDDPSSFEAVSQQFAANVMKVATGLTLIGADEDTRDAALKRTVGGFHGLMLDLLPGFLPEGTDVETVSAVLDILASPLSGVLIGFAGPAISPGVALLNSALAISAALQTGDTSTALSALLNMPASAVNGFLNGADLDLSVLAPLINDAGVLPDGMAIAGLDFAFGGLLTPGATDRSPYDIKDEEGNVIKTIDPVGGSIFNSIGLKIEGLPISIESEAVGPIGAMQGLSQTVGVLLGSGWDDYDGKGNAPAPTPPLFGLDPLTFGDPLSDIAESPGVTKLRDMLKGAAINDIVKKLQGIDTDTEAVADKTVVDDAAAASTTDTTASEKVAAATELTHTTANKMVAVTVPAADTAPESATAAADVAETPAVDATEKASTTTPPKLDVLPKAPATRPDTSFGQSQRKVGQGIRDAVKNARNGFGGSSSRTSSDSSESTSGSTGSSTGSSSSSASNSDKAGSNSSAKAKAKAKPKTTKDSNKD